MKQFNKAAGSSRQRRSQEEFQTSQYARSLIEASLDSLVTISPEGKITDVNEATIKVTDASRERLIGADFSSYFTEPRVPIQSDTDVVVARQEGRTLATQLGFSTGDLALIATAISEVARNIVNYAKRGEVTLGIIKNGSRRGIAIIARDDGPGIADVELALQDGYSTSGGLGLGLPGAKRLMDEFDIVSEVGKGTVVTMRKWVR